jgi:hypothetical protein
LRAATFAVQILPAVAAAILRHCCYFYLSQVSASSSPTASPPQLSPPCQALTPCTGTSASDKAHRDAHLRTLVCKGAARRRRCCDPSFASSTPARDGPRPQRSCSYTRGSCFGLSSLPRSRFGLSSWRAARLFGASRLHPRRSLCVSARHRSRLSARKALPFPVMESVVDLVSWMC